MSAVEQYVALAEKVAEQPFARELHKERIAAAKALGALDELESARAVYATAFSDAIEEDVWLEWLNDLDAATGNASGDALAESWMHAIDIGSRAAQSLLSIPVLVKLSQLAIRACCLANAFTIPSRDEVDDDDGDEEMVTDRAPAQEAIPALADAFSLDSTRSICATVLARAQGHLAGSRSVWQHWRAFETSLLRANPSADQFVIVESLFLDQLARPHLDIEETFQQYSRFVTQFDNQNYDRSLPAANKIYTATKELVDEREAQERALSAASESVEAFQAYLNWELGVKTPNTDLVRGLVNRLVARHLASEQAWTVALDASRRTKLAGVLDEMAQLATQAIPSSAAAWTAKMRSVEQLQASTEAVDEVFQSALGTRLFDDSLEGTVRLYEARVSAHRRELDLILENSDELGVDLSSVVEAILEEGIKKTRKVEKSGDPYLRLEKYLLRMYERFQQFEQGSSLWKSLAHKRSREYAIWQGWADFETRRNNIKAAHEVYVQAINTKNVDYPEYLVDAWLNFEKQNGSLSDYEFAENKGARLQEGIARRRQREALALQQQQQTQFAEAPVQEATSGPVADNDATNVGGSVDGRKRANSASEEPAQAAKRLKTAEPPKRDRENSTVFVIVPKSAGATEADFRKLFRDCGEIRELVLKSIEDKSVASIEFAQPDSVMPARTKDKKKIHDEEVEVHIAWQSCLYITNFPPSYDQNQVEALFAPFGLIFETRWPSKRFKATRRFCYIQYVYPTSAQQALSLHGKQLESDHPLSVMISEPTHRKSRTDAKKNACELRIGNLNAHTTDADLNKLFSLIGEVKEVRLVKNADGTCKGLAFVEMQNEHDATQALNLNNAELRKKHISVVLADERQKGTAGTKTDSDTFASRAVHLDKLGLEASEADIQQAFEKFGTVKKIVLRKGTGHATVEFESAAVAGHVALENEVDVAGQKVKVSPYVQRKDRSTSGNQNAPAAFQPRQMRGGLRGRGRARVGLGHRPATASASSASVPTAADSQSSAGTTSTQDDFRKLLK